MAYVLVGVGLSLIRSPLPVKVAIWLVLALSLFRLLRNLQHSLPTAMKLQADGRLSLLAADGTASEHRIAPDTTVMPWLVVLRYLDGRLVRSLTLPVDALGAAGHRQLRTWLRWRASVDPE